MAASIVTIIDSAPARERRDWQAWFEKHWPRPASAPCPSFRVESDPLSALERPTDLGRAVVLIARGDAARCGVLLLADALDQHSLPLYALVDDVEGAERSLGGIAWASLDSPPREIIARLETILQRQTLVDRLSRELALARRLEGGVTGEINRMHEELELAASVQREFLPKALPRVSGLETAALFRPSSYVSGDIYNLQRLDDSRLGFFVADATGHGVPAALMTVLISRSLSFHRGENESGDLLTPGQALARLNRDLAGRGGGHQRFATAVCGIIDAKTCEVTLACAGHPPPLLIDEGGVHEIEAGGSLLGVFPDEKYEDTTIRLDEGDRLIAYTDGFELAFPSADQDISRRRLPTRNYMREFARLREGCLAEAMLGLEQRLDEQAGSLHQVDDLTVLAFAPGTCVASSASTAAHACWSSDPL